jgi:hypothetical protein
MYGEKVKSFKPKGIPRDMLPGGAAASESSLENPRVIQAGIRRVSQKLFLI